MFTEMLGKGGNVCSQAKKGIIRCPLIIRPTSEDSITGYVFQSLRGINPRWWLPQLLNTALEAERFRQQVFRDLKIELWKNRPPYPRDLLPWREGSTQVDVTISWENPPTTIFVEVKYTANLSASTVADDGSSGFPSDQLIRNARVGLLETGWFRRDELFRPEPRDFALIVFGPKTGNALVETYRDTTRLLKAIPHSDRLIGLPPTPFVGELSYNALAGILKANRRWLTRPERTVADDVAAYLEFKTAQLIQKLQPKTEQRLLQ